MAATLATACVLWAGYLSLQPTVLPLDAVDPLMMSPGERLDDGRVVVRARFLVGPTLLAGAAVAAALLALGALQYAWRRLGVRQDRPHQALRGSRAVLALGGGQVLAFLLVRWLVPLDHPALPFIPVAGGLVESACLFLFWRTVLEALRQSRPLLRETALWLGLGLALVPPTYEALATWWAWTPPLRTGTRGSRGRGGGSRRRRSCLIRFWPDCRAFGAASTSRLLVLG